MASSVNKVILIGNLGADPENRHTQDGRSIANLRIAAKSWRDKATGERRKKTEWHRVVIFNGIFARLPSSISEKGSKVSSRGALQTRANGRTQSGQDLYSAGGAAGLPRRARCSVAPAVRSGDLASDDAGVGSTAAPAPKAASAGGVRRSKR
jgi:hypothetical protein